MRQLFAIILLSLQLLTGTELCQLFKAPILFEHYREHRGGDKSLTFVAFLRGHYLNGDKQDPDYLRDRQLPFKTNAGFLIVAHSISIPIPASTFVPPAPAVDIKKQYHLFQQGWLPSLSGNRIFQPPRRTCLLS